MKILKLLTERECKERLYKTIVAKQKNKIEYLPKGDISISLLNRLRFLNGEPWKRVIHFKVGKFKFLGEINPYTGDIISIGG